MRTSFLPFTESDISPSLSFSASSPKTSRRQPCNALTSAFSPNAANSSISAADALNSGGLDTAKFLALGFGLQTLALVTLKFGIKVKTLKMPATAKGFFLLMAMGMMIILAAVVAHVIVGQAITDGSWTASKIEQWTIWIEAARRIGVVIYLFAITLGLITIATVIRYQTFRIREIAASRTSG